MMARNLLISLRNKHLLETFKCLLALSLGVTLKTLYDMPANKCDCPRCPDCEDNHELLHSELHFQLREAFSPRNVKEVLEYEYFNMSHVAANSENDPFHKILRPEKNDIKDMVLQMMPLFNSAKGTIWKMLKLENGYRRIDPLRGEEYVIDAVLSLKADESHSERHRFEMVKPFGAAHMIHNDFVDVNKMIHFILPVSDASPRFYHFMQNFENVCLKNKESVYLLILLFTRDGSDHASEYNKVKAVIANLTQRYHQAHIRIIHTKRKFSVPLGLDLGSRQFPTGSLVFICNVDIFFTREFLSRCRLNAMEGKQVYYPVGFAQYSPNIVNQFSTPSSVINLLDINKNTGLWSSDNYELSCMHITDYRAVNGVKLNSTDWHIDLFQRHIAAKIKVFRALDPGLIHVYQNETCSTEAPTDEWQVCMDRVLSSIGSRQQLSRMLLKYLL